MRLRRPGALLLGIACTTVMAGITTAVAEDPAPQPDESLSAEARGVIGAAEAAKVGEFLRAVHDQQVRQYLEAAARPANYDHWIHIHNCEQPDGDWHAKNGRLGGGLGILHAAWRDFGGREFSPTAAEATPEQQMTIANRIYDRYGPRAWGCK